MILEPSLKGFTICKTHRCDICGLTLCGLLSDIYRFEMFRANCELCVQMLQTVLPPACYNLHFLWVRTTLYHFCGWNYSVFRFLFIVLQKCFNCHCFFSIFLRKIWLADINLLSRMLHLWLRSKTSLQLPLNNYTIVPNDILHPNTGGGLSHEYFAAIMRHYLLLIVQIVLALLSEIESK